MGDIEGRLVQLERKIRKLVCRIEDLEYECGLKDIDYEQRQLDKEYDEEGHYERKHRQESELTRGSRD